MMLGKPIDSGAGGAGGSGGAVDCICVGSWSEEARSKNCREVSGLQLLGGESFGNPVNVYNVSAVVNPFDHSVRP